MSDDRYRCVFHPPIRADATTEYWARIGPVLAETFEDGQVYVCEVLRDVWGGTPQVRVVYDVATTVDRARVAKAHALAARGIEYESAWTPPSATPYETIRNMRMRTP